MPDSFFENFGRNKMRKVFWQAAVRIAVVIFAIAINVIFDDSSPSLRSDGITERNLPAMDASAFRTAGQGTAFPVNSMGDWLTAKHVVEKCSGAMLALEIPDPRYAQVYTGLITSITKLQMSNRYDIALVSTNMESRLNFALSENAWPIYGMKALHVGYPSNQFGYVKSQYLGTNRFASEELNAWAEKFRYPDSLAGLGGISGGPVVNEEGNIIGMNIASTQRRGRVLTSTRDRLNQVLVQTKAYNTNDATYAEHRKKAVHSAADDIREKKLIARIYCKRTL